MSMVLVAAGTVTIVVMILLFGATFIDVMPYIGDTGHTKTGILVLYGVYLAVAYGGVL